MDDEIKNVFISYAWSSEDHIEWVLNLANRLNNDGIRVFIDQWDLKEGQNIYAFMEQCVNDPSIKKVLIICDKKYAEKANNRIGGVGTETSIISPEVYSNAKQEKFLPIVMEKDENGNAYLPTYLKSNLFLDLAGDKYEAGYEELVRNIYDKSRKRRPKLGKRPNWLDEEPSKVNNLKVITDNMIRNVRNGYPNLEEFIDEYIVGVKDFYRKQYDSHTEYLDDFVNLLEYRNVYLELLKKVDSEDLLSAEFITHFFERLFNETCNYSNYEKNKNGYLSTDLELFRVHVWELFVCTITFLLNKYRFDLLRGVLVHTYFIYKDLGGSSKSACAFTMFRVWPDKLEGEIKYALEEHKNKYTLLGHYMCRERVYEPMYSGIKIAEADLFLYQVYKGLNIDLLIGNNGYWFPNCYVYSRENDSVWKRLVSKEFCYKVMVLFNVNSLEQLIDVIKKCQHENQMGYNYSFDKAPDILSFVKIEDIGKLP